MWIFTLPSSKEAINYPKRRSMNKLSSDRMSLSFHREKGRERERASVVGEYLQGHFAGICVKGKRTEGRKWLRWSFTFGKRVHKVKGNIPRDWKLIAWQRKIASNHIQRDGHFQDTQKSLYPSLSLSPEVCVCSAEAKGRKEYWLTACDWVSSLYPSDRIWNKSRADVDFAPLLAQAEKRRKRERERGREKEREAGGNMGRRGRKREREREREKEERWPLTECRKCPVSFVFYTLQVE